jgi:hypothetical protein
MPTEQFAQDYPDKSVIALTPAQAAGTDAVLPANINRKGIKIMPVSNGKLYFNGNAAADGAYYPLYAGVLREVEGQRCPTGALYVTGQAAGTKLRIAEASDV